MCWTSKACIVAWWIAALVALLLWYRGHSYDRVIAAIIFVLGLIQLINYGCHSAVEPTTSGKSIIILLVVLLLVITVSTYLYTNTQLAMWLSVIVVISLLMVVGLILMGGNGYLAFVDNVGQCPNWTYNGKSILDWWIWPYTIMILICWVLLMSHHDFTDIGLYLVGIFVVLSGIWASEGSTNINFGSRWTYILVGLGLLVWLTGLVGEFSTHG